MQRPKRPGRFHNVDWVDMSRPGTPTPDHSLVDPRLRNRYDPTRRLNFRRRVRDLNWMVREVREGLCFPTTPGLEAPLNLIQEQAPPPRPAPPPPLAHEPLPGPSTGDNNDVMARLLSVLECPVCFEYVSPPILQCREGHLVCSGCRARLDLCPKCRQPFVDIRARALEQVAEVVPYPCYNNGCGALLPLSERQAHEVVCPYRQYPCTVEPCSWLGKRSSLPQHMMQHHPANLVSVSNHEVSLTLTQHVNEEKTFLMHCFDELFHCVMGVDCQQDIFVGLVMYLGPREKAAEFEFELKFKRDTPPYTSVVIRRSTLEESPVGTQLSGTSAVVISFSTLREVIQDENPRAPVLTVHIDVTQRTSGEQSSPASPEQENSGAIVVAAQN